MTLLTETSDFLTQMIILKPFNLVFDMVCTACSICSNLFNPKWGSIAQYPKVPKYWDTQK